MKSRLFKTALVAGLAAVSVLDSSSNASAQTSGLELVPPSETPAFNGTAMLELRLEGPFATLFKNVSSLPPIAGKESNDHPYAYSPFELRYHDPKTGTMNVPVWIRVRGNTSKKDCSFPKLALRFSDPNLKGKGKASQPAIDLSRTIFAGANGFRINTHCADEEAGPSGEFKRQRNQFSPTREALTYRVLETLGIPTLKARPSRITYVFTDSGGQALTRNAMLLETTGQFAKRMGGQETFPKNNVKHYNAVVEAQKEGRPEPPDFTDASVGANMVDLAMAYFANPIIGNHDWSVMTLGHQRSSQPLWNIMAMARKDGTRYIVPYDFDLASFVTHPEVKYVSLIKEARGVFLDQPGVLEKVRSRILSRREHVRSLIKRWDFSYRDRATGQIKEDSVGRENMLRHIEAAFKEIERL